MNDVIRSSKERLSDANLEYHAKSGTYDIASMAQELIERRRNETGACPDTWAIKRHLRKLVSPTGDEAIDVIEAMERELAELRAFKQAVLDPENQPSQFGTVLQANELKAGEQRHGAAHDFVSFDPQGGVWIDMARYLRSPAGQAQLEALGGKKAVERQPCSHGNATGHCQHCLDAL